MSGIVGVVNFHGRPADRQLVERLTSTLQFRGPDARRVWVDGCAGFGHTMLRTTWEAERETQPCSLDGEVWIVADLRIDDRQTLRGKLGGETSEATDPELVLRAYAKWGEGCVDHLLGDFAFAIWDGRRRRLFCARDHFGVKPFYYARLGNTVVFSNTLNTVRAYPGIRPELNELAICDFLLFGCNQEPDTTSFLDVERLAQAHTLVADARGLSVARYWKLGAPEMLRYRREQEYIDHFWSVLSESMRDRLRCDRAAVLMSGGLDSTTLAANALEVHRGLQLKAFTYVFDWLIPDDERKYAGMAAEDIGLPVEFIPVDELEARVFEDRTGWRLPEPSEGRGPESMRPVCEHARVVFFGEGPDNLLNCEITSYLRYLVRSGEWWQAAGAVIRDLWDRPRIPFVRRLRRSSYSALRASEEALAIMPAEVISRLGLEERTRRFDVSPVGDHPFRPSGHGSMSLPLWQDLLRSFDAEQTGFSMEARHPYLDLRMVSFLLSLPSIPWAGGKYLLRRAMKNRLRRQVLRRPKTPLQMDPIDRASSPDGMLGRSSESKTARLRAQRASEWMTYGETGEEAGQEDLYASQAGSAR